MTIQIIKVTTQYDQTGEPVNRSTTFIIDNGGGVFYSWSMGGIPLSGSVQTFLNSNEAQLWADASAGGKLATTYEISLAEARAWYVSNPGAKADVFDKAMTQLNTDITNLVNASFPAASAAVKTAWVRVLMSSLFTTRSYTFERELV